MATSQSTQTQQSNRTRRVLMFDISPWLADFLYDVFTAVLVFGAFAVVVGPLCRVDALTFVGAFTTAVGTYGSIKFGTVKEYFSNERISANELATEQAKTDSEIAKRGTAEASERAANALREAEQIKSDAAWRKLSKEQHIGLKLALDRSGPPGSVQFTVLANDPESLYFAQQFSIPFKAAGWRTAFRFESYATGMMFGIMVPEAKDNWLEEMKAVNFRVRESLIAANIVFVNGWPPAPHMWIESEGLPAPIAWVYIGPKPMPLS